MAEGKVKWFNEQKGLGSLRKKKAAIYSFITARLAPAGSSLPAYRGNTLP